MGFLKFEGFFLGISWDLIFKLNFEKKYYKLILRVLILYGVWDKGRHDYRMPSKWTLKPNLS